MERRIIQTEVQQEDEPVEKSLRPQTLDEYIGQEKAKNNLRVYIQAAKQRAMFWITCFSTGRRDLEKQPSPESLPMRWAPI
jgi:Holliday junction resolvasome RuvABC ATP-dependent DNA helicase subunit